MPQFAAPEIATSLTAEDGPRSDAQLGLQPAHVDPSTNPGADVVPPGREDAYPFRLREATPDPVGLARDEGMRRALGPDWTSLAYGLGGDLPSQAGGASLAIGMEELCAVTSAARAFALPVPDVGSWSRQPAYVRHCFASRAGTRRTPAERTLPHPTKEQTKYGKVLIDPAQAWFPFE
jgi:hypothetical protein